MGYPGERSGSLTQGGEKGELTRLKLQMGHDMLHEEETLTLGTVGGVIRRA